MQYLLTQAEYDSLTPVERLQERNEALEVARRIIISDEECYNTHYCNDCKIGGIEDQVTRNHLCVKRKNWAK